MTPVMLPTSEWSAKWYHLHKWKFFHGQIELMCRFSTTLKGALYPRGLSTLEVQEACYLLMLECCMAHWGLKDVVLPRSGEEGVKRVRQWTSLSPGILEQDKCILFSSQKEIAPSLALLYEDSSLSPQWEQLEGSCSGLHYHFIARTLWHKGLGFLILNGAPHLKELLTCRGA